MRLIRRFSPWRPGLRQYSDLQHGLEPLSSLTPCATMAKLPVPPIGIMSGVRWRWWRSCRPGRPVWWCLFRDHHRRLSVRAVGRVVRHRTAPSPVVYASLSLARHPAPRGPRMRWADAKWVYELPTATLSGAGPVARLRVPRSIWRLHKVRSDAPFIRDRHRPPRLFTSMRLYSRMLVSILTPISVTLLCLRPDGGCVSAHENAPYDNLSGGCP
jgi:hypothetical protein